MELPLKDLYLYGSTLPILMLLALLVLWQSKTNTYTCVCQSSTNVICYDHDGSLFKLFKRAPDKFTVIIVKQK